MSRFVRVSNRKDGTRDPERYHSYVCFNHELLTAKLNAYVVSPRALRLIHGYLPNRKQRTTIDDKYYSWSEILFGVPQWPIFVKLFFNIFLAYLFLVVKEIDIVSYVGDNTPFIVEENIKNVTTSIEEIFSTSFD